MAEEKFVFCTIEQLMCGIIGVHYLNVHILWKAKCMKLRVVGDGDLKGCKTFVNGQFQTTPVIYFF